MQIDGTSAVSPASTAPAAEPVKLASPTTVSTSTTTPPRVLNPDLHIDPSLGIVVTQYFSEAGNVTMQFPTAKAIQSYSIYGMADSQAQSAT